MKPRMIREDVYLVGAVDWDRRMFDALVPLPDGTSYNAYLVQGLERTALLDTVDPSMSETLMAQLDGVERIDYIVAHHAEQDHSGSIPLVLSRYPGARVVCNPKCKGMLMELLGIPDERFVTVEDRETLSLGGKTLEFIFTPWVHWPETMASYLKEDRILFSCDLFGSHLATSDLYSTERARAEEAAKRYYAEIMMPFRTFVQRNLERLAGYEIDVIAPSHGPLHDKPSLMMDSYREWASDRPGNLVVVPYVSMHGSTRRMVEHLVGELVSNGLGVRQFDLTVADIGKLAVALVDAATIVIGTSTVHVGPHPLAVYAAYLANSLKSKARFASVVGSYGWGTKAVEQITSQISGLKVEMLEPVVCRGFPGEAELRALEGLAESIAQRHRQLGLM